MIDTPITHPETGEVLECYGDIIRERGKEPQRSHGPVAIEVRNPSGVDGQRFYCPECEWLLDEFLGVAVEDVRRARE